MAIIKDSDYLAQIAEHILGQKKDSLGSWEMPWNKGFTKPINIVTGRVFRGSMPLFFCLLH
jgi:hypothetical protein